MFFAQALRKKLYSNFADKLSKKDECLFPFKLPKKSNINYYINNNLIEIIIYHLRYMN